MARGINKVILIGNLGADPETRYSQGGNAVTKFRIATSENWRDRQTGEQQERTEWHNIVCFQRLAEIAGEYLKKGSRVYIEGSLSTSSWEDQQSGQKRYRTEIIARDMQMLDSRSGFAGDGGGVRFYTQGEISLAVRGFESRQPRVGRGGRSRVSPERRRSPRGR